MPFISKIGISMTGLLGTILAFIIIGILFIIIIVSSHVHIMNRQLGKAESKSKPSRTEVRAYSN